MIRSAALALLMATGLMACSTPTQTARPLPAYIGMDRAELEDELGNTARETVDADGRTILTYIVDLGEPAEQRAALSRAPAYCTQATPSTGDHDRRHYDRCARPEPDPVRPNPSAFICPVSFTLENDEVIQAEVDGRDCRRNSDRNSVRDLFERRHRTPHVDAGPG